jgi:hypothetical protein
MELIMKFLFTLLISLLLLTETSTSQTAQWAQRIAGDGTDYTQCVAADDSGNVYISGFYSSGISFNNGAYLPNSGGYDSYIAKYSRTGTCLWAQKISGELNEIVLVITLDKLGNIFVAGYFNSPSLTFNNGTVLTNNGNNDAFIAKYSSNGNCQWVQQISGKNTESAYCISVDESNNIFLGGYYSSAPLTFNNGISLSAEGFENYIAKYDSTGKCLWAQKITGGSCEINSIGTDGAGNVYLGGYFSSASLNFNNFIKLMNPSSTDAFLAKYNSGGTCQWAQKISASGSDECSNIAVDKTGNVFLAGYYSGSTLSLSSGVTLNNIGSYDGFFAKYSTTGNCVWAQKISGTSSDYSNSVAIDNIGNVYVVGNFMSTLLNFNKGISLNNSNNNNNDVYVAKYTSAGSCLWAERIIGSGNDNINFITVKDSNNIYITGNYVSDTLFFNNGVALANKGNTDGFLAKYSSNSISIATLSKQEFCKGEDINVICSTKGAYGPSNIFSVELSDATGNFADPVTIGTLTAISADTIIAQIPLLAPTGTKYRMRIVSSDPFISGPENNLNLTIYPLPNQYNLTGGGSFCVGGSGKVIGLEDSQTGMVYQLQLNGKNIGKTINGTGEAISFGNQSNSGTYTVIATNTKTLCSQSMGTNAIITINQPPDGKISGKLSVCQSNIERYSTTNIQGFSRIWSVIGGEAISDSYASSIDIKWGNQITGKITLYQKNEATGCEGTTEHDVIINPLPAKPTISEINKELSSSPAFAYQWYIDSIKIEGADKQTYKSDKKGLYKVEITDENGCSSMSDVYNYEGVGVEESPDMSLNSTITPNPNNGKTIISFYLNSSGRVSISLFSPIGNELEKIYSDKYLETGLHNIEFDGTYLSTGSYLLLIDFEGKKETRNMVIVK